VFWTANFILGATVQLYLLKSKIKNLQSKIHPPMSDKDKSRDAQPDGNPLLNPDATWVSPMSAKPAAVDTGATFVPPAAQTDVRDIDPMATIQPSNPTLVSLSRTSHSDNSGSSPVHSADRIAVAAQQTMVPPIPADADPATFFAQTIGNHDVERADDDQEWFAATQPTGNTPAAPAAASVAGSGSQHGGTPALDNQGSRIWGTTPGNGLDGVVAIRSRPVSGDGPFSQSDDADFEIIQKLAEGGMGVVYLARQKSLNRELAIKTLKPAGGSGSTLNAASRRGSGTDQMTRAERQRREMFLSEAVVTANLVHPNIIPIHDLCQTADGTPYYAMKRVHGIPWNKRVRDLSLEANLEILDRVCDAVAFAHHHGVINRDLKPENIMLGEFGEVMVLDWGLAVPALHAVDVRFRSPNATHGAGTPAYMSPELWSGPPEAICESSDVYLLGAILFEVITGFPPHRFPITRGGGTSLDTWKVIDEVLRENQIRETSHSGELLEIAYKALKTDPDQRYGSVLEFQFSIRNYQRHEDSRRLSIRAKELVDEAAATPCDYHTYQTSAALFEESQRIWPNNVMAQAGLRNTRLRYAQLASSKGDYDLGLQVAAQETSAEFVTLSSRLRSAKRWRSGIKWTACAAMLCVVLLGAKSVYDNGVITNLNEEVAVRKGEAEQAIVGADKAKAAAAEALAAADAASLQASAAKNDAADAQAEANRSRTEAAAANERAVAANQEAATALADANTSKQEAANAIAAAEAANLQVEQANQKVAVAETREADALSRQEKAETASRVAQVEIQSQSIRGLTLNQNYSDALREINRLLDGKQLSQLPDDIRRQRTIELQAQRDQLLKRTRATEEPIQSQAVSSDGRWIALGDSAGRIIVLPNPGEALTWSAAPLHAFEFGQSVSGLQFTNSGTLVITAGSDVAVWNFAQPNPEPLNGHSAQITGLDVVGQTAVTGDDSGMVIIWNLTTLQPVATIRTNTNIRDLALLPDASALILAGARGGQSADVLAYRIPKQGRTDAKSERLGQLRLPRDHNDPPARISVSPDGSLLILSNSRNGNLLVLPAAAAFPESARNRFPFQHPDELEAAGLSGWLLSEHRRPVNEISWSADSRRIVTASDDRTIGVWQCEPAMAEPNRGAGFQPAASAPTVFVHLEKLLKGHGAPVSQAAFLNAAGTLVTSASADRFCRLWNLSTIDQDNREILRTFKLITSAVRHTPFSPFQGEKVAGRPDEGVELLDRRKVPGSYMKASFCSMPVRDEETALTAGYTILNADSSQHRGSIRSVRFSSHGKTIVTGAADGSVVLWNAATHQPVQEPAGTVPINGTELFHEGHEFNVSRMQIISAPQPLLATTGFDGSLRLWNMDLAGGRAGVQQRSIAGLGLVNSFAASPDGEWLITSGTGASESGVAVSCSLWKVADLTTLATAQPVATLTGLHHREVTAVAFSTDSQRIATGGRDGVIGIWSLTGLITSFRAHTRNTIVSELRWMADSSLLSAGLDGQLSRWQVDETPAAPETQLIRIDRFERDKTPIEDLCVAPDDQQVLAISVQTDRTGDSSEYHLDLWAIAEPSVPRRILLAHIGGRKPNRITSAQWSADGQRVLVCADDAIQILRTSDWKVLRVVNAAGIGAADAQFVSEGRPSLRQPPTPDLVASFDGTSARLWDLNSGEQLAHFRGPFAVGALSFSKDSEHRLLVTGGHSLRVFQSDPRAPSFGSPLFRTQNPHPGQVTSLDFSPVDHSLFVSAGSDGSVALWRWIPESQRADRIRLLRESDSPPMISAVSVQPSPDDPSLPSDRQLRRRDSAVVSVRWSPNGQSLLVVSRNGKIAMLRADVAAPSVPIVISTATEDVELSSGALSADGLFVVVTGQKVRTGESTGWVYRVPSADSSVAQAQVCQFSGHGAGGISCGEFLPDSPYLVSGGNDGSVILWNWQQPLPGETPTAYEAYRFLTDNQLTAHRASVTSLSVSTSGQVITASDDGTAILWENPLRRPGRLLP